MNTGTSTRLLVTAALTIALTGCSTADKEMAPPPKPAPVAAPAPPPPPPMVKAPAPTYVIEGVNFDFDKSTLKPTATNILDGVARKLSEQGEIRYEVAGFTDSVGSDTYNQSLSERRAAVVREYLVAHGVDGEQLTTRGYGEANPVAGNDTQGGRAKNRRVEVRPVN